MRAHFTICQRFVVKHSSPPAPDPEGGQRERAGGEAMGGALSCGFPCQGAQRPSLLCRDQQVESFDLDRFCCSIREAGEPASVSTVVPL